MWRKLKGAGALYLQQSACVFPDLIAIRPELRSIRELIEAAGAQCHLLPLQRLDGRESQKLIAQFLDQTARRYTEIVSYCRTDFQKEVEFEIFRGNLTPERADQMRRNLRRVAGWVDRITKQDWFGSPLRSSAARSLQQCEMRVTNFETRVPVAERASARSRASKQALETRVFSATGSDQRP